MVGKPILNQNVSHLKPEGELLLGRKNVSEKSECEFSKDLSIIYIKCTQLNTAHQKLNGNGNIFTSEKSPDLFNRYQHL